MLKNQGLINDERYAAHLVDRSRYQGMGPRRVFLALKMQGIAEDIINQHLNTRDEEWSLQARKAWQKRFKGQYPTNRLEREKQRRFLQYRGFTEEHINPIFRESRYASTDE